MDNMMYALGDHMWETSTKGRVFHSADKGATWTASQIGPGFPFIYRVAFYDELEGIAVNHDYNTDEVGNIYRTHDGGATWNLQSFSGSVYQTWNFGEAGLFIVPGSNIVFSGAGSPFTSGSSYSADSGLTWIEIDNSKRYGAIDGKGWNSLWTGQYSNTVSVGGIAKWDGIASGIKQNVDEKNFSITPNPSNGEFKIELSTESHSLDISIEDITGKVVFKNHYETSHQLFSQEFDLNNLHTGIYFMKVMNNEKSYCRKIIIAK